MKIDLDNPLSSEMIAELFKLDTDQLVSLIDKITKIGPSNAAVLDAERGIVEKDKDNILILDEELIPKIKFIKEGEFSEQKGATTLKLVGNVHPVDHVEIIRIKKQNITEQYPLTFLEMRTKIKIKLPNINQHHISGVVSSNDLKNDTKYSAYNFRSKQHEDKYKETGIIPSSTPSLYNEEAMNFIIKELKRSES
ncbi:MAG: hypothetical protein COB07_04775 [Sulfurovum sp.]|nr:MAG: hypothetical protein COB07_04775 [Sulfurovum sp.]